MVPFGLSTASILLAKLLRPLTSFWNDREINICVYLDDKLGREKTYCTTISDSQVVGDMLKHVGFVINLEMSEWHNQKHLT